MHHFHTQKERFKEFRNGFLFKAVPFFVLSILGGIAILTLGPNGQEIDMTVLFLILFTSIGAGALGIFITVRRIKQIFRTYRLTLDTDEIIREAHAYPTLRISKSDIKEIVKNRDNTFAIKGKSLGALIAVPAQIADYEKLELLLAEIRPITLKNKLPFFHTLFGQILLGILSIGLMATVYNSENKITVAVGGIIIIGVLGKSFFETYTNKYVDQQTKKMSWFLLLVMVSIIGMMYFKLMG